jgi:hypothetical protein
MERSKPILGAEMWMTALTFVKNSLLFPTSLFSTAKRAAWCCASASTWSISGFENCAGGSENVTVSSADMVAQISSCSIFQSGQLICSRNFGAPTIFKISARTSSTSAIRTFLPISAKPRVKYVEVSFLINLRGTRSSAWSMSPMLPSYMTISGGQ